MNKCVIKVDIEVLEVETDLAGLIQKGEFNLLIANLFYFHGYSTL